MKLPTFQSFLRRPLALAALILSAVSAQAEITVVNTDSLVSASVGDPKTGTLSFDAGATADKVIVQVSAEGQNVSAITYHGDAFTEAAAGSGHSKGIFYLDNPYTGGAADLTVTLEAGNSNGIAIGVVAISGSAPGAATAEDDSSGSVTLVVPVEGSFVVSGYGANGSGTVTLPSEHAPLYNSGDIGSAHGAAGYANGQAAGSQTYQFGDTNPTSPAISSAAFVPVDTVPAIVSTSPTDDVGNVPPDANLKAIFNETVEKGSGSITIHKSDGSLVEMIDVATATAAVTVNGAEVTIDPSTDFDPGTGYYVLISPASIEDTTGNAFAGISDPTAWSFTTRPSLDTVDGRLAWAVQENIDNPWPGITDPNSAPGVYSYALACLYLNTNVSQANDLIVDFYTNNPVPDSDGIDYNGYFWQHLMWRLYHDPAMHARLTPQARASIEVNMWLWLRTRSHISEAQGTEWVYHGSENHDAMQKGSHLLCALALKNAPGYGPDAVLADGNTIAEHAAAWSDYFQRYFAGRAREGINAEIACPIYAKYTVGVYYNLMDFAESPVLRNLAEQMITLYWADTASDWTLSGVRGGGETRCYKENYLRLGTQYSFNALLWGYGWHGDTGVVRTYPMIPAVSPYRVPEIITACAADPARPNFLYTSRRWGRTSGSSGDNNFVTFDSGNSNLRRDTWVTPDYSMGTLTFDMNRDYLQIIDQNRAMGVMFASGVNDRVMIFGKGASSNNKSYADLSGVCRENCMVVQRDQNANSSGNGTMIFVAQSLWDSRVETGGWLFLQTGNAYCAIKPAGSGYTATSAQHGYDLELGDLWAPVVVQMEQASSYASFAAFQTSVMGNAFTYASGTLDYTSESGDTFTVYANSKTTPKVNGTTVDLNPVKTYDSPYLSMVHGEDVATVSYSGYPDLVLDFGGPPLLVSRAPADNSTEVPVNTNLVATFGEPVQAGTGFITLKKVADDSTVQSFDVTNPSEVVFSGSQFTIDPGSNLAPGVEYYVLIDATAVEDLSGNPFVGLAAKTAWNFANSASAITVVNTGSKVELGPLGGSATTLSFDAGASADLLVVALSHERSGETYSVTYAGETLAEAVSGGSADIWYLDLAAGSYAGGAADVVVDYSGIATVNGVGIGVVSVSAGGDPVVLHATGAGDNGSDTVNIATTADDAFLVASFNANGSGAMAVGASLSEIYANDNIGSSQGAAGFKAGVAAGAHAYSYTASDPRKAVAAAFVVGANDYSGWIAGYPGVGPLTGFDDDPDGDSLTNGIENFFGTAPDVPSTGLVMGVTGVMTGESFTFNHPQNAEPADDLTAAYRWSTDLVIYQASGATDGGGTRVDFVVQQDTPTPGITTVTATVTGTAVDALFQRVEVSRN